MATSPQDQQDITGLLLAAASGDGDALDRVIPTVYRELRQRAERMMRSERSGHTLGTTGLLHETLMRLRGQDDAQWINREQFFAVASLTMRRILVNWARDRARLKRGGAIARVSPVEPGQDLGSLVQTEPEIILAVDGALRALEQESERAKRVVECRYFTGLTVEETAQVLDLSPATVKRDWQLARAWLQRRLSSGESAESASADQS